MVTKHAIQEKTNKQTNLLKVGHGPEMRRCIALNLALG